MAAIDLADKWVVIGGVVFLLVFILASDISLRIALRRREKEEERPVRSRTSLLALASFGFGMLTALTVLTVGFLLYLADSAHISGLSEFETMAVYLAAKILTLCSLVPALGTVGFWMAARGAILESDGALRGISLYRTGILMTVLALVAAFAGRNSLLAHVERCLDEKRLVHQKSAPGQPTKDALKEECRELLEIIKAAARRYEQEHRGLPLQGGDSLAYALKRSYLKLPGDHYRKGRIIDPWGGRIEWIRTGAGEYLLYSHGPDGVDDGGGNDDVSVRVLEER